MTGLIFLTGCTWIFGNIKRTELAQSVCQQTQSHNHYQAGSGSTTDPFVICKLSQWQALASRPEDWGASVKLGANLDFSGLTLSNFPFVGSSTTPFTGNLDGGGFKMSNINLTGTSEYLAIFPYAAGNVRVNNLSIENVNLTNTAGHLAALIASMNSGGSLTLDRITVASVVLNVNQNFGGGLVARTLSSANFSNITTSSVEFVAIGMSRQAFGSVVGHCQQACTLSDISASNILSSGGNGFWSLGGVVGLASASATLSRVTVSGVDFWSSGIHSRVGGVVGAWNASLNLSEIRVSGGNLRGSASGVGGLAGDFMGAAGPLTVTDSSFSGTISANNGSGGGLVGTASEGITVSRSKTSGNYSAWTGTVGGLIGQAQSASAVTPVVISDSYSSANLTTTNVSATPGGLSFFSGDTIIISRSYFSGSITGSATSRGCFIHRLAGVTNLTVNDGYFDATNCIYNAANEGAVTGVTPAITSSMQPASPFTNWNNGLWIFNLNVYPRLTWE